MIRFTLFRIPIEIQPWFWLTMALLGGLFGATTPEKFLATALFVLAGFFSILVHELGHALAGRAFGVPSSIVLYAFGGFANFPAGRFSRGQDFLVTLAGPAIQILLGGFAFTMLSQMENLTPQGVHFFRALMGVSLFWALINLIPILPLDGGRLMASILGPARMKLTLQISFATAVACGLVFLSLGSFLFSMLLGMMAWQNWQALAQFRR